jgi:hypothetical protein
MREQKKLKNIFADKASLILRRILAEPERKWVVRDFIGPEGVSLGMAQEVLEALYRRGYVERVKKGPESYSLLTNPDKLVQDWLIEYRYSLNEVEVFYSPERTFLKKIMDSLESKTYAFTLHTGANLLTSFVNTDHIYFYLDSKTWQKDILEIRQNLGLRELVHGGNIHIIRPYYKKSVFFNAQTIKKHRVVSNLQLYLDLYHYHPRGREHAEYLKKMLDGKGKELG